MQTLEQFNKTSSNQATLRIVTEYIRKHAFKVNSKHIMRNITYDEKHNIAIQFIGELQQIHPITNGIAMECLVCIVFTFQNEIYKQPIELTCANRYYNQVGRPINKIYKFIHDRIVFGVNVSNDTNNVDNIDIPLKVVCSDNINSSTNTNDTTTSNDKILNNDNITISNNSPDTTNSTNNPNHLQTKQLVINMFKSIKTYRDTLSHINQTIHDAYLSRNIPTTLLFYIMYYLQQHLDDFRQEIDVSIAQKYILKLLTNWDKVILIFDYLNELNNTFSINNTFAYNARCGNVVNKHNILFRGLIDVLIDNKIIIDIKCSKQNTYAYYARQLNMYRSFVEFQNNLNPDNQYKHDDYKLYTVNILQNKIYEFPITDIDINEFTD